VCFARRIREKLGAINDDQHGSHDDVIIGDPASTARLPLNERAGILYAEPHKRQGSDN